MKLARLKFNVKYLFIFVLFPVSLLSSIQSWQTVVLSSVCTFKIPDTMEVQAGTYKVISDKITKKLLHMPIDPNRVIVQQKKLNSYNKESFKKYARIMVETEYGNYGDYENINTQLSASKNELKELTKVFREGTEAEFNNIFSQSGVKMELLSWFPVEIVEINGVYMIHLEYSRSVNGGPEALVNMYIVQNNDRMHRITISYRKTQSSLYKSDLEKVIYTFVFKK